MLEERKGKPKKRQCKIFMQNIFSLVKNLEDNLIKTEQLDRETLMAIGLDRLKFQSINLQFQEIQRENQHLISMFQLGDPDTNSRSNPVTSYSTMSLVHLQYKYEELWSKYNGLLKILEMRLSEIRKAHEENENLTEEIHLMKVKLHNYEDEIAILMKKMKEIRITKKIKISKLRNERNTLRLVHNKLVAVLNDQCMEKDHLFAERIKFSLNPEEALLTQEIRKNNLLSYENFQLQQKIEYLQSILHIRSVISQESISSKCMCKILKNKK